MVALFSRNGVEDIVAEEVTILPGLEEGAHLLWINKYMEEGEFDVLIVDAAPTAETLRLLSLPDVTRWWFMKVVALTRGAAKILRPIGRVLNRGGESSLPDDDAWDQVKLLFDTLDKVRDLLADPAVASVRLVVNPEKMVIKETQRTYTYLNLYGYATDAIICNRIIPDEVTDPYFDMWKDKQKENIAFISEAFGDLPLMKAPLFGGEVSGLDALRKLSDALYGDSNPAVKMFDGTVHRIESDKNGGYRLLVPLPFANKDDMDLYRSRDELTLRVGPYRRNIVLPYALWDLEIADARFEEQTLSIRFAGKVQKQRTPAANEIHPVAAEAVPKPSLQPLPPLDHRTPALAADDTASGGRSCSRGTFAGCWPGAVMPRLIGRRCRARQSRASWVRRQFRHFAPRWAA
jgi:arsenite-transporting ATPase